MAAAALLAVPAAAKAAYGIYQDVTASKRLKNLGDRPSLEITPEMQRSYQEAEREAGYGFSPQEKTSFFQRQKRRANALYSRALPMAGGGLSQAINAAVLSGNIQENLDFTAQDAALRRDKRRYADARGDIISNQRNRIAQEKINYRNMVEQALGMAKQQGRMSTIEGVSEIPSAIFYGNYLKGISGNGMPQTSIPQQGSPFAYSTTQIAPAGQTSPNTYFGDTMYQRAIGLPQGRTRFQNQYPIYNYPVSPFINFE